MGLTTIALVVNSLNNMEFYSMNTVDTNLFSSYVVTGQMVDETRFSKKTQNPLYAFCINLWRGSVWGIRKDNGKRKLIKRVWN